MINIKSTGFCLHICIRAFQLAENNHEINNNILTTAIAVTDTTPASGNKIAILRAATKKNDLKDGSSSAKRNLDIINLPFLNCIFIKKL
jgi:hypothetical protein